MKNKHGFIGPLTLMTLQKSDPILDEKAGVYMIWHDGCARQTIYVGEVSRRPVRKRLEEHLTGDLRLTNKILRHWIKSEGDAMKFCFFPCLREKSKDYEDAIREVLVPVANPKD